MKIFVYFYVPKTLYPVYISDIMQNMRLVPQHAPHTTTWTTYYNMHHIPQHASHTTTCITHYNMHHIPQHAPYTTTCTTYHYMYLSPQSTIHCEG
ncbi:hypothetical protein FHG87_015684 [Trinorchestia longiramus]|nr:hypothetical protein FHG87_015684 [Trinorchestia longiramus]